MKFDAIVGNPPYNIVINDKSSQAKFSTVEMHEKGI